MAKGVRYTIGSRIENKLLDLLELAYVAYFTKKQEKTEKITGCIFLVDTIKFLTLVAWEGKLISNQAYEDVAMILEEIGKILWGWRNSIGNPEKKNRTL